ncbi:hypothetical protein QOM21_03585 [Streptomyces sp. Pv4-95]|uniref:hypothetical protein n=1 Tax=Streptomyces sp. Pv4-95 TaxID=3049543 RepID=UPI003891DE79
MDADRDDAGGMLPALCDVCGAVITDHSEVHARVPDSSVVHPDDPELDGWRPLTACSAAHLAELRDEYERRPYIDEEQWAGKMSRALDRHPDGLTFEQMAAITGLTRGQLDRAFAWHNLRVRRNG